MRKQFSSNTTSTGPIIPRSNVSSLLNGYRSTNLFRSLSNQTTNIFNSKSLLKSSVPKVIAATLILFETKHLLTSYYREKEIISATEQIKNEDWTNGQSAEKFTEIAEKKQHTPEGAAKQTEFRLLQEAQSLLKIFKNNGEKEFINEIITKYNDWDGEKFRHSSAFKELFKRFTPQEKEQLLATIKEQILTKDHELEILTTEPGWLWGRRQKTEKLSFDEVRAVYNIKKELKILNETNDIIEQY